MTPLVSADLPKVSHALAELRRTAYSKLAAFVDGPEASSYLESRYQLLVQKAHESGSIQIFGDLGRIRGALLAHQESQGAPWILELDLDPRDPEAVSWAKETTSDLLRLVEPSLRWTLPDAYREVLPILDPARFHVSSRFFAFPVSKALAHFAPARDPKSPAPSPEVDFKPLVDEDEIERVVQWKEDWYRSHPQFTSASDVEEFLEQQRTWLRSRTSAENSLALLALAGSVPVGFCGAFFFPTPLWGRSLQIDLIYQTEFRGRGLTRLFAQKIAAWAKRHEIQTVNVGTAQRPIMKLSTLVPGSTLSWAVAAGPSPFPEGHFDL